MYLFFGGGGSGGGGREHHPCTHTWPCLVVFFFHAHSIFKKGRERALRLVNFSSTHKHATRMPPDREILSEQCAIDSYHSQESSMMKSRCRPCVIPSVGTTSEEISMIDELRPPDSSGTFPRQEQNDDIRQYSLTAGNSHLTQTRFTPLQPPPPAPPTPPAEPSPAPEELKASVPHAPDCRASQPDVWSGILAQLHGLTVNEIIGVSLALLALLLLTSSSSSSTRSRGLHHWRGVKEMLPEYHSSDISRTVARLLSPHR